MPRAIWSGAITFGLVNVPVRMYSAIAEKDVHFHFLHTNDDSRIGYEKVCKKEHKPVPDREIERAYEIAKGEYVYVTEEDFHAAEGPKYKTIDIREFVAYEEIDPIYFERTFFLGPADGAEKVYVLLRTAMERSGLAAIAKYVMRGKQQLGCLRVRDGVITLEKMYFADEIRPLDEIKVTGVRADRREPQMAGELIDRFTGRFDIEKYKDDYRRALMRVIRAKHKGREVHVEKPANDVPPDLMDALRASVQAVRAERPARRHTRSKGNGRLEGLKKDELVRRARRAGVNGYSGMSKDELISALAR